MSKLSRSVLKEIVKECIVEVFEESFFPNSIAGTSNAQMNENLQKSKSTNKRPKRAKRQQQRQTHLDNISFNTEQKSSNTENVQFKNKINEITSNLTSDPVMSDIFKDTAMTTLQEQSAADSHKSKPVAGDQAARVVNSSSPEELFGNVSSKWAQLAFAEPLNK